ncbi:MAG: amidohydrolase family protein [Gemmatimonadaceae bacterium]
MTSRVRWHARWVLPIVTPPITDGTVVTEDDRIVWVGPRASAPAGGRDEDLGDALLTPGLVNAHSHLDLTMMRGFLADLPFFAWVRTLTRARGAVLESADFLDAALAGVAEGLRTGITCFGDTAPGDESFEAMRRCGVRGIAYREVFGPDPADASGSLAALKAQVAAMRERATPLVGVGVSPHAPYSVSDALYRAVGAWAQGEALPVAVHIGESDEEVALVTRGEGPFAGFLRERGIAVEPRAASPLALLQAAGLVRPGTLLIHCVHVDDGAAPAIAGAGCGVAHCPVSNATLGHGIAPLTALVAAGARVGLGTDSMASNQRMDLFEEARVAALQQRARSGRPDPISPRAALRLATLGGAEALRLDALVGSLEAGKQADLAAFEPPADIAGSLEPEAVLVLAGGPRSLRRVVVAGAERVRDGEVLGADPAVPARVADAAERLNRWRSAGMRG